MAINDGWRIKEIIEPKVPRDWTEEDAKKHVGYAWRSHLSDNYPGLIVHANASALRWSECEYAAPIPGTDPAKWGWKPCKVEVPAPEAPTFNVLLALSNLEDEMRRRKARGEIGTLASAQATYDHVLRSIAIIRERGAQS